MLQTQFIPINPLLIVYDAVEQYAGCEESDCENILPAVASCLQT